MDDVFVSLESLRTSLGLSHNVEVMRCPTRTCGTSNVTKIGTEDLFLLLLCQKCKKVYYICTECTNLKSTSNRGQVRRHWSSNHSTVVTGPVHGRRAAVEETDPTLASIPESRRADTESIEARGSLKRTWEETVSISEPALAEVFPDDEVAQQYYLLEAEEKGRGARQLVARQFTRSAKASWRIVSEEDAELHFRVAKLLLSVTSTVQEQLGEVFRLTVSNFSKKLEQKDRRFTELEGQMRNLEAQVRSLDPKGGVVLTEKWKESVLSHKNSSSRPQAVGPAEIETPVPNSSQALRRYLEGEHSIIQNIPVPKVHETPDGQAYVDISDVLAHLLAQGLPVDAIVDLPEREATDDVETLWQTKCARDLFETLSVGGAREVRTLVVGARLWEDEAETNSQSKSNRDSSMHTMTMTVEALGEDSNKSCYSFPLSISRKDHDHTPTEDIVRLALKRLSEPSSFYHGKLKKNISVQVVFAGFMQDRPARTASMRSGSHTGSITKRSLHLGDLNNGMQKILPSCSDCWSHRKNNPGVPPECQKCGDWDYKSELFTYRPPAGYPRSELPVDGKLRAREITFDGLIEATSKADRMMRNFVDMVVAAGGVVPAAGDWWHFREAEVYLKGEGLDGKFVARVMENCKSYGILKSVDFRATERGRVLKLFGLNRNEVPIVLGDAEVLLNRQVLPVADLYPPVWFFGHSIHQHVDVPMHLIFLGLCDMMVKLERKMLLSKRKNTLFAPDANKTMASVGRLRLGWCLARKFTLTKKPTAGMVSENLLALARIAGHLYPPLLEKLLRTTNPSPSPAEKERQDSRFLASRDLAQCYTALAARAMTRVVNRGIIKEVDRHAKLLLSAIDHMDVLMIKGRDDCPETMALLADDDDDEGDGAGGKTSRTWTTKGNCLSVLNVARMLQLHGPVILWWEGGPRGEKIFREMKPLVNHGVARPGFAKNSMKKFYKIRFISNVLDSLPRSSSDNTVIIPDDDDDDGETVSDHDSELVNDTNDSSLLHNVKYGDYRRYRMLANFESELNGGEALSAFQGGDRSLYIVTMGTTGNRSSDLAHLVVFADDKGQYVHGNWYAPLSLHSASPTSVKGMVKPKRFVLLLPICLAGVKSYAAVGSDWRNRFSDGEFGLPRVDGAKYC
jgi:hypothetical protein